MSQNLQHLAEVIISTTADVMISKGFVFDIASSSFVKQSEDIRFMFQVAMAERHGSLTCSLDVGVRSDRVEEILHRTSEFGPADGVNTATLGVNIKLLTQSAAFDICVADESHIAEACQKITRAFYDVAVPYFADFGSLDGVDAALNSNPSARCVHMINERARCSRGLIVAKLLRRQDYETLLGIYDNSVRGAGMLTYEKYFRPLVDDLEQLFTSE